MRTTEFQDIHGVKVTVQMSSSAEQEAFRLYFDGEGFEPSKDKQGRDIPRCIHINRNQAEILIAGLRDLFED